MAEHVEAIGRRIRERREALGMTQAALARKLSGNPDGSQVSRWERGEHEPGPDRKEEIARALKTTVATFLSDPPKKTKTPERETVLSADDSERLRRVEEMLEEVLRRTAPNEPTPSKPDTIPPPEEELGDEPPPRTPERDAGDTGEAQTG